MTEPAAATDREGSQPPAGDHWLAIRKFHDPEVPTAARWAFAYHPMSCTADTTQNVKATMSFSLVACNAHFLSVI